MMCRKDRTRQRHGTALFVVTIVIVLVSLTAYGFVVLMQAENRAAHLSADQIQVQLVAESAAEYLRTLLSMPRVDRDLIGGWSENPERFRDVIVDHDVSGQRHGRFSVVSPRHSESDRSNDFQFGVECTSARLSLSALLQWDQREPGSARLALMRLPGMSEAVADSILDWIDDDDQPREFGGESDFYLGLNPPRSPINQVPTHLDMLLAVRGVSRVELFGASGPSIDNDSPTELNATQRTTATEDNTTSATQPQESISAFDSQLGQRPWSHFLTVYSAERNETYDGLPRINLNQADLTVLHEQLSSRFNRQLADFVVTLRQSGPAEESGTALPATGLPAISLTEAATYELTSPLDVVDAHVGISGEDDEQQVFKSPVSSASSTELSVVEFCDHTTTFADSTIVGRVDLNHADREVLEAIPYLPLEAVEQVLSMRPAVTDHAAERRHATWLLAEGIVDHETMQQLLPFVTVAGDVIQGEIVAYYDRQSPWYRHEFVFDGTREEIPWLFYRDLRRSGRGYRYEELSLEVDTDQPQGVSSSSAARQIAPAFPANNQPPNR